MEMPGRSYNATAYRFGYTGHEQEGDLAEGVYTTQYRLLDTRLGRWLSVDPLFGKYPDMGAYNYCAGNPVGCWDPDGREPVLEYAGTAQDFLNLLNVVSRNKVGMYKGEKASEYLYNLGNTEFFN